jgi:hypothetical protein
MPNESSNTKDVEEEGLVADLNSSQEIRHRRSSNNNISNMNNNSSSNNTNDEDDDRLHSTIMNPGTASVPQQQRLPIHETNVPLVCCAILASITTGGTTYAFGLYGDTLKKSLHLSQSQLDTISAVFFSAGLLSFIPGGFADKFGTRLGISIGGVSGATSLLAFWVVSKGFIPFISDDPGFVVFVLSGLSVGIFLSCALVTGSVFKIISCHCGPGTKGSAVGVAKGFVGLGVRFFCCACVCVCACYDKLMLDLFFLPPFYPNK